MPWRLANALSERRTFGYSAFRVSTGSTIAARGATSRPHLFIFHDPHLRENQLPGIFFDSYSLFLLLLSPGGLVEIDPQGGRNASDGFADQIQRKILDPLETNAGFAHIQ